MEPRWQWNKSNFFVHLLVFGNSTNWLKFKKLKTFSLSCLTSFQLQDEQSFRKRVWTTGLNLGQQKEWNPPPSLHLPLDKVQIAQFKSFGIPSYDTSQYRDTLHLQTKTAHERHFSGRLTVSFSTLQSFPRQWSIPNTWIWGEMQDVDHLTQTKSTFKGQLHQWKIGTSFFNKELIGKVQFSGYVVYVSLCRCLYW